MIESWMESLTHECIIGVSFLSLPQFLVDCVCSVWLPDQWSVGLQSYCGKKKVVVNFAGSLPSASLSVPMSSKFCLQLWLKMLYRAFGAPVCVCEREREKVCVCAFTKNAVSGWRRHQSESHQSVRRGQSASPFQSQKKHKKKTAITSTLMHMINFKCPVTTIWLVFFWTVGWIHSLMKKKPTHSRKYKLQTGRDGKI